MATPTTAQRLQEKYWAALATALPDRSEEQQAVDAAFDVAELDVVPRVWGDERHWRLVIAGVDEPRVIASEDLARELALALIAQPTAPLLARLADDEETHAYVLLGADGLRQLDQRRAAAAALMQAEVVEALDIALSGGAERQVNADAS
ncbi:hypothetical protein ACFY05_42085 [Microtetraspora fusca]|uniref:Type VII secretion system-associated protein n=1 Tax=Microtetraspora fusca TaxID=1997 RepID=A0ABW6VJ84_MICFU